MAERKSDDMADALHAMMGAEAAADEGAHETDEIHDPGMDSTPDNAAGEIPAAAPINRTSAAGNAASIPSKSPGQSSQRPSAPPLSRPRPATPGAAANPASATAGKIRPAIPGASPAASGTRPAAPVRPAAPTAAPGGVTSVPQKKQRPAAPGVPAVGLATHPASRRPAAPGAAIPAQPVESDASEIIVEGQAIEGLNSTTQGSASQNWPDAGAQLQEPAATVSPGEIFRPRPDISRRAQAALKASLHFKQTLIPPLLTCAVLLLLTLPAQMIGGADSPLAAIGTGFAIAMGVFGIVLLGLAVIIMWQVREHLKTLQAPPAITGAVNA